MAINSKIEQTVFTDQTEIQLNNESLTIKEKHINDLRNAINALNQYAVNVDNCSTPDCCQGCQNTCICQSNKCQSCQNICTQCTTLCERCQESCICQSSRCESCQDSCTQCSCQQQCNCNCDCGGGQSH